ncbi:MAG TPA: hypothetical protein K8V32_03245 [Enteractinococcus helveticum]|uniref:Uncharacterized protein n=1 Tax=Enteractinococcus helveticum TaxID=1837282 RepID=A0A921K6U4_9MICC|nr:hypothetical protein [Enteractinococcus helveticum]HJF13807.1 hypothetical protein [Enteractinococcus helveticum]
MIFVLLALIVLIMSVIVTIKAFRNGGGPDMEDAPVVSRRQVPAGFITTSSE